MPPFVSGELFGLRVKKKLIYIYKITKKWKKIGTMCDTIFYMFLGQGIMKERYFGDKRSKLALKMT